MSVTLDVVSRIGDVAAGEWDALVDRCGAAVFYRHQVLAAYEVARLGGQHACVYALARDASGTLVGALPVYLLDGTEIFSILGVPAPVGGSLSRAAISHFPHCYDTCALLADWSPRLALALWFAARDGATRAGAGVSALLNVPADGPLAAALAGPGQRTGLSSAARWYLDVAAFGRLEPFLATMGRATRKTLRSAARRAEAAGAQVDLRHGTQDVGDVAELCAASAAKHGTGYYPAPGVRAFLAGLGDALTVLRVHLDGRTLAASVCLKDGDVLHTWAGGAVYPDELNWSPNHVLFYHELRLAFALGVRRLECGRRNDAFKARHRLSRRDLLAFVWTG